MARASIIQPPIKIFTCRACGGHWRINKLKVGFCPDCHALFALARGLDVYRVARRCQ